MTDSAEAVHKGINATALENWFIDNIPKCTPPLSFELIAGGQSNLTFKVEDSAGMVFVLRRPPLGRLPSRAHDVAREYRIQAALRQTAVPVPDVVGVCTDNAINGADFYVMNWVDGTIVDSISKARQFLPTSDSRRAASHHLIDTFAGMHRLDLQGTGLATLSKHEDFVGRSLERMLQVWKTTRTRDFPLIESLYRRLVDRKPQQTCTGLIHCDYRFGNVMLDSQFPRRPAKLLHLWPGAKSPTLMP